MAGPEQEAARPSIDAGFEAVQRATQRTAHPPSDSSSKRPVLSTLRSAKSFILLVVIFAWFTVRFLVL